MARHITSLSNNVRIVTQQLKDRASCALGIWIGAGGRFEHPQQKGVAHYLEHMVFKGSKNYSCEAIKQTIEGVGGNLNAFTAEEETCYYAKVPANYLATSLDVLTDIAFFPKFNPKEFNKERTVILEEIKMYLDLPQYHVAELLQSMLWPNHPLGQSLAGNAQTVSQMALNDLKQFHQDHYVPNQTVIACCGQVDHERLVSLVRQKLGKLTVGETHQALTVGKPQGKAQLHIHHKNTEQMHVALGYLSFQQNHPDYYALSLLSIILGGNMSSRLFNEVREKRGLAYSISCGMRALKDTGCFVVRAGVDNHKLTDALSLILKELKRIADKPVSEDEFKRARDYYIGQFQLGLEDTMDHMLWLGLVLLTDDRARTVSRVIDLIKKVTISDVTRVAKQLLALHQAHLCIIGPVTAQQEKSLKQLLGIKC